MAVNILVIGNGFDLAHHLPTQYSNFLDFVKAFNEPDDSQYHKFIDRTKEINPNLYHEIGQLIEGNILIEFFLSVYNERCKDGKNGWIDFESEISLIVQKLDEAKQDIEEKYSKSGKEEKLDKVITKILNPIIVAKHEKAPNVVAEEYLYEPRFFDYQASRVLEALNRLTRLLEIYLYNYVEELGCKYRIPDIDGKGIDRILSFNYTDTYRKYYDPEGKADYCFIHGKAQDSTIDSCNLVLGIDEYLPHDRVDTDNQFVWFKKFYQRIYKETDSSYLDWINSFETANIRMAKANPSKMSIFIYGHSLDVTDKDVLSRLILTKNATTYIFYHNREAMATQISNLVKVIGEESLIRMTGGKERTIFFVSSSPATIESAVVDEAEISINDELKQAEEYLKQNPVLHKSPRDVKEAGVSLEDYLSTFTEPEQEMYRDYYEDEL